MLKLADSFLNRITMYRLTLYYLIGLILFISLFSLLGIISYNPFDILLMLFSAVTACYAANYVFANLFKVWPNAESVFISALILVLIIPVRFPEHILFIILASIIAMGSKYLIAVKKRHIFNPAAVSVAALSFLSPNFIATWWIGMPVMFPFVLLGGLFLMRKIRREDLIVSFILAYVFISAASSLYSFGSASSIFTRWTAAVLRSPLLFFSFVMLTEPLTSPANKKLQRYYAYLTALLYSTPQLKFLNIVFTPEVSLCIANIFSYVVSPNYRLLLPLKLKTQLSTGIFSFIFRQDQSFKFLPGQYMEWTLSHRNVDSRGNRRYFSIASSPTEQDLMLVVKVYNPSSSYKRSFVAMQEGQEITASQLSGDFILPKDLKVPLVFIAGGIGIAPFRSMIKYILDKKLNCNIILIYSNRNKNDILFEDIFSEAKDFGVKTVYILTGSDADVPTGWEGLRGHISDNTVMQEIPDYKNRTFYLSGPQMMVSNFVNILKALGIQNSKIKLDFFPGYTEES